MSEKLPKDIVFLIIGSVAEAFKGAKVPLTSSLQVT